MGRVTKGRLGGGPTEGRRGASASLGLVLAAALALLGPAGPASAHDVLEGSDPADGVVLDAAPSQVVLTFSADQLGRGAAVTVTGPDGAEWAGGAPVVAGTTVTQALAPGMPSAAYTVEWRSVSGDGHPTGGSFAFTLVLPSPVVAEPTVSTESPSAVPSPEVAAATPEATMTAVAGGDTSPAGPGIALGVGGIVVVLLIAAGILGAVRRQRRST